MSNLEVNIAGIKSPNPFWLASGPPTNTAYQIIKAFTAGWGGAVWKTLGQPIANVSSRYGGLSYKNNKLLGLNNLELISEKSVEENVKEMKIVKEKFPKNALIASLMFEKKEEWHDAILRCEDIGIDGFELNFGCPHGMCERGMGSAVGQNPDVCEKITSWVMEKAKKPVIVKLTPNVTDITKTALSAQRGGANAVSLINTINSVTGINLNTMNPNPSVDGFSSHGGYCGPAVKPIALNMVSEVYNHPDFHLPIVGIGGIETWQDACEFILMGAQAVQVCTAVMHYGFRIVTDLNTGVSEYLSMNNMKNIIELSGISAKKLRKWEQLDLNFKTIAKIDSNKCISCQLCYIACDDSAYQSITLSKDSRIPIILEDKCVGCNLCSLVCPVDDCITMVETRTKKEKLLWKDHPKNIKIIENDKRK